MKAAVISKCGERPSYLDYDTPRAGEGQVLLRVNASPITPLDLLCASGTSYWGSPSLPYIPGVQGMGRVVGDDAKDLTRSYWFQTSAGMATGNGAMSEYVLVERNKLFKIPEGLDEIVAASLGFSAVAALGALTLANLRPNDTVLVLGANGIVGQVALQLAKLMGAGRVVAGARSKAGLDLAESLGVDATVDLSDLSDMDRVQKSITEACHGQVNVVVDPIFGDAATLALRQMAPNGRFVNLGSAASETATFDSATIRSRNLSILGYTNAALNSDQLASHINKIFGYALAGNLRAAHEVVSLDQVGEAWDRQHRGVTNGRIVLVP